MTKSLGQPGTIPRSISNPTNYQSSPPLLFYKKETTIPGFFSSYTPPTISFIFQRLFGSFAGPSPAAMSAAKTKAQNLINENGVVVFSKSYCPYCKSSKELLDKLGAKYELLELDQIDDGSAIQSALQEISNQRTVPNIFIKQKHIGGNSDLQAIAGQLPALLKEAGAV